MRSTISSAPRVFRTAPLRSNRSKAVVIPALRTPSIMDRRSWVSEVVSSSSRSWARSNNRRQTFHERVAGVAQDRLRLLDEQCVHIIHQLLAQRRASIHGKPKGFRADLQGLAFHFHDAMVGGAHDAQHDRYPNQPGATDDPHLHLAVPLRARHEDGHAALDEIDPVKRTMGLLKDLSALETDTAQVGLQARQYVGSQRLQDAVPNFGRMHVQPDMPISDDTLFGETTQA